MALEAGNRRNKLELIHSLPLRPVSADESSPSPAAPGDGRMVHLANGQHVWLRSVVSEAYVHADEDGRGVSLRPDRASRRAAWRLKLTYCTSSGVATEGCTTFLHIQGAAYGRYLAGTKEPAPPGHRGFRVEQHDWDDLLGRPLMWRVLFSGWRDTRFFCHVSGYLLRGNGYRWDTAVTIDSGETVSPMMYWVAEPIPWRDTAPLLPAPPPPVAGDTEEERRRQGVRYVHVERPGKLIDGKEWVAFPFAGRSVFNLREELARRLGEEGEFTVCVRAGRYAGLTPLVVDLPVTGDPLHVIIFTRT